jgi:hypothetical protein
MLGSTGCRQTSCRYNCCSKMADGVWGDVSSGISVAGRVTIGCCLIAVERSDGSLIYTQCSVRSWDSQSSSKEDLKPQSRSSESVVCVSYLCTFTVMSSLHLAYSSLQLELPVFAHVHICPVSVISSQWDRFLLYRLLYLYKLTILNVDPTVFTVMSRQRLVFC